MKTLAIQFDLVAKRHEMNIIEPSYRLSTSDNWGFQHGLDCLSQRFMVGSYTNGLGISDSPNRVCGRSGTLTTT